MRLHGRVFPLRSARVFVVHQVLSLFVAAPHGSGLRPVPATAFEICARVARGCQRRRHSVVSSWNKSPAASSSRPYGKPLYASGPPNGPCTMFLQKASFPSDVRKGHKITTKFYNRASFSLGRTETVCMLVFRNHEYAKKLLFRFLLQKISTIFHHKLSCLHGWILQAVPARQKCLYVLQHRALPAAAGSQEPDNRRYGRSINGRRRSGARDRFGTESV